VAAQTQLFPCPASSCWCSALIPESSIKYTSSVHYRTAFNRVQNRSQDLLLDEWAAPSATPRPGAVVIHGGSYSAGPYNGCSHARNMSSFAAVALALAQRGFAVISIDYRCEGALRVKGDPTSNFHPWYDAVEDARAAVRWLKADASRLSVDTARITAFGGSAGAVTVAQLLHALPDSVPMPQLPPPALAPTLCAQALEKACPLPQFTTDAECLTCTRLHAARPVCSPAHRQSWCNKCCRRGRSSTGAAPPLPAPSARGGGNITCGIALSGAIIPASIAAEQVTASAASAGYLDIHGTNDSTVPYDWALARGDNETWGDAVDTRAWLTAGGTGLLKDPCCNFH